MRFQRQSNWMGKSDGGPKTDQIVQEKILSRATTARQKMIGDLGHIKLIGKK